MNPTTNQRPQPFRAPFWCWRCLHVPCAAVFFLMLAFLPGLGCKKAADPGNAVAKVPAAITTESNVEMVLIPAGSFEMGSRQGREDERPSHKVMIDAFLIDKYEVTQEEYEKLGAIEAFPNPSHFKGAKLPVEQVKYLDAARFCNARSKLEGLEECYDDSGVCHFDKNGYRLPTEAEWEYACRAGTDGDYSFGSETRYLGDYGWFADNAGKKTHPVGQKKPNHWGLYDMHGNVAEWCHDVYDKNYYQGSPQANPRGPAGEGKEYVLRGGSWKSTTEALRSCYRLGEVPGFSDACLARDAIGFRCVRKAPRLLLRRG
jgi:formylglycine-generating enzyme required for sulfatase activity